MDKIRILLVDDHAVVRSGLTMLMNVQSDMEVVGEAADGNEGIAKALELKPDVVLMDLSMPHGRDGFSATSELKKVMSNVQVLILTMHDDEEYLFRALKVGAAGYVLKSAPGNELLHAIRTVYKGEAYLYPTATKRLIEGYLKFAEKEEEDSLELLSPREKEILSYVATGYSNKEIADKLIISVKTVENHKAKIMEKLQLTTRPQLVKFAIKKGLLELDE
ncbi:response regulator transcription factor [Tepidibacillus fermentans]|uniref:LuxR family two component transcriptional regulator n=1 Tax=Tepidibacillus fermentans TaxID=1281767 RepID=A0A4R3KKZ1_9BACI|nr:response regulator transcription factor [Tepidibacillus fermentans]TCS84565.1 LuxR family two component transcriptional regulator [Tepidibacillus fermentans]